MTECDTLYYMETVTRDVALVWRPARYRVVWAHTPDEVPPFDPSRGGDPFHAPAWSGPDGTRYFFGDWDTLGGKGSRPDVHYDLGVPYVDPESGVESEHSLRLHNYPRLVRVSQEDVGEKTGDLRPLEEIAALTQYVVDQDFMEPARLTAERFGPLAFGEFDFTLTAWKHAAIELDVHLRILKHMGDMAQFEESPEARILLDAANRQEFYELVKRLVPELSVPRQDVLRELVDSSGSLRDLREGLSKAYWSEFQRSTWLDAHRDAPWDADRSQLSPPGLVFLGDAPGQIRVRCGCLGWAFYELWQRASKGGRIRECDGCGRLFRPKRRDARHCQEGCRVKSFRRRAAGGV